MKCEHWEGPESCCVFPEDYKDKAFVLSHDEKLIGTFEGETWAEIQQKHYDFHSWGKYNIVL